MRVFDLALMFIRASVVMAFLREGFELGHYALRYIVLPIAIGNFDATRIVFLQAPVVSMIASAVILAASKPMARFAAKLSATTDVAGHF